MMVGGCVTMFNDDLYIIGGRFFGEGATFWTSTVYIFHTLYGNWSEITSPEDASFPLGYQNAGCVATDDSIYIFGGFEGVPGPFEVPGAYLDMVIKYDVNNDSWSNLNRSRLNYPRENVWCHYYEPDEYIYCIGGDPIITNSSYQFIDVFDVTTETFVDMNINYTNITNVSNPRVAFDSVNEILFIFNDNDVELQWIELNLVTESPTTAMPTGIPTLEPTEIPTLEPTIG